MTDAGLNAALTRLASLKFWPGPPDFSPIPGGRTNLNFMVRSGGRTYFARVGHDLPHHRISRATELKCLSLAAAAGVAPEILHAANGLLVTSYFDGATLSQGNAIADDILLRLATALRRLWKHDAPADLQIFDPVEVCRNYINALPAGIHGTVRSRTIEAILGKAPARRNRWLIHADLIPENVIVSRESLAIVDWEYAGRGDKDVDIAAVAMNFGLDERQTLLFGEACGASDRERLAAFGSLMALREALWCDTQRHFVGVKGDLEAYSALCWSRIDGMAE
ncbi:MAG: phosphotransferase family protein [Rhodospirillales bacterium]|nr:phosphotransferase family protein [Rhodospirillales bacterium]